MSPDRQAEFLAAGYTEDDGTVFEPGISVFEIMDGFNSTDDVIEFHIGTARNDDVDFVSDRPAFLVTGNRLDITGFCGEPLLADAQVIGSVELVSFKRGILTVRRTS